MSTQASSSYYVDAPPAAVMDLLLDIEALPEWSSSHKKAEIVEEDENGYPAKVKIVLSAIGLTDEQLVAYEFTENTCRWEVLESSTVAQQIGCYTLEPSGAGTQVSLEVEIDLKIKLPSLIIKKTQKTVLADAEKAMKKALAERVG